MAKYYHFNTIDSTSSYLKHNYKNYDDLSFVSSDFQENGHGRFNRKWISNAGDNLLFSVLIKDEKVIDTYSCISIATSVCIYEILKDIGIDNVSIKWPNDVYVKDKKIAGILLESISSGKNIDVLIIGVGINVNCTIFDESILKTSTSIYLETKNKLLLEDLKEKLYKKIIIMLDELKNGNKGYLKIARNNNYLKNKNVYAYINGVKRLVKVIDIDDDNSLIVEDKGSYLNIYSGEVSFNLNDTNK